MDDLTRVSVRLFHPPERLADPSAFDGMRSLVFIFPAVTVNPFARWLFGFQINDLTSLATIIGKFAAWSSCLFAVPCPPCKSR